MSYHPAITTEQKEASNSKNVEPDCPAIHVVRMCVTFCDIVSHCVIISNNWNHASSHLTACDRFLTVRYRWTWVRLVKMFQNQTLNQGPVDQNILKSKIKPESGWSRRRKPRWRSHLLSGSTLCAWNMFLRQLYIQHTCSTLLRF